MSWAPSGPSTHDRRNTCESRWRRRVMPPPCDESLAYPGEPMARWARFSGSTSSQRCSRCLSSDSLRPLPSHHPKPRAKERASTRGATRQRADTTKRLEPAYRRLADEGLLVVRRGRSVLVRAASRGAWPELRKPNSATDLPRWLRLSLHFARGCRHAVVCRPD
jgi:hypothetical protein